MLFVTKSGTRREVRQAIAPMIRIVEMTDGIPADFWDDPEILGFLIGSVGGLIKVLGRDKFKQADIGEITTGVLTDLAGPEKGPIVAKYISDMLQYLPEFQAYSKAGALSVLVAKYGVDSFLQEPVIIEAINALKTMADLGAAGGKPNVTSAIQVKYYYNRVQELNRQ